MPSKPKPIRVVVDRSRWACIINKKAGSDVPSMLHHKPTDTHCCLGFAALACGIPLKELTDKPTPSALTSAPEIVGKDTAKKVTSFRKRLKRVLVLKPKSEDSCARPFNDKYSIGGVLMNLNDGIIQPHTLAKGGMQRYVLHHPEAPNRRVLESMIRKFGLKAGFRFVFTGQYIQPPSSHGPS